MTATKKYYSVKEIADLLGINRVTIFRWIKLGKLKAEMVGGSYIVLEENLPHHLLGGLSDEGKVDIEKAVKKAMLEYGETFRALAAE